MSGDAPEDRRDLLGQALIGKLKSPRLTGPGAAIVSLRVAPSEAGIQAGAGLGPLRPIGTFGRNDGGLPAVTDSPTCAPWPPPS